MPPETFHIFCRSFPVRSQDCRQYVREVILVYDPDSAAARIFRRVQRKWRASRTDDLGHNSRGFISLLQIFPEHLDLSFFKKLPKVV